MRGKSTFVIMAHAFGIVLLLQALRVFLPSLTTVFDSAGTEHPEQMGLMAVLLFLSAFAMLGVAYLIKPRLLVVVVGCLFVASTLVLQASHGGSFQWYASAATLALGLYWLALQAMVSSDGWLAAMGIAGGIVVETILHSGLWTMDLVWLHGALPWVLAGIIGTVFLVGLFAGIRHHDTEDGGGSSRVWLITGPALFMTGTLAASGPRAETATADWPYHLATSVLLVVMTAALILVWRGGLVRRLPMLTGVALLIGGIFVSFPTQTRDGIVQVAPAWTFYFQLLLIVAVLSAYGHAGRATGEASPLRRGLAAAVGMFMLVLLLFGFYGTFELVLGFPRNYLFVLSAIVIGLGAWQSGPKLAPATTGRPIHRQLAVRCGSVVLVVLLSGLISLPAQPRPTTQTSEVTYPVRVMTYNIQMGYSFDGRFNPQTLADDINNSGADIVTLNEVDRGWFLNGGHDALAILSAKTGMPYVWAPSAGTLWGDAILSRAPVMTAHSSLLPQTDPIQGVSLRAVIELADGQELGVITAHEQSEKVTFSQTVARDAARLSKHGTRPVVMMGDFNMQLGDPQLEPISRRYRNALESDRPIFTFSSKDPVKQIDQIFVSKTLVGSDIQLTDSIASDHRGVSVNLHETGNAD